MIREFNDAVDIYFPEYFTIDELSDCVANFETCSVDFRLRTSSNTPVTEKEFKDALEVLRYNNPNIDISIHDYNQHYEITATISEECASFGTSEQLHDALKHLNEAIHLINTSNVEIRAFVGNK